MDKGRLPLIDLMRAGAALIVAMAHAIMLFQQMGYYVPSDVFLALSRLSHEAVLVFFLLSGYLVGGSVWCRIQENRFDWTSYLILRLNRLWLPLIPALLLTALLDHLGIWYFNYDDLLKQLQPFYPDWWHLNWTLSLPVFFSNLFFAQMLFTEQYGTNLSLWTLSNEFWYYLLFPLVLTVFFRRRLWAIGVLVLMIGFFLTAALIAEKPCCTLDRTSIYLTGFMVWLLGVVAAVLPIKTMFNYLLVLLLSVLGLYLYVGHPNLTMAGDVGFAMMLLLLFFWVNKLTIQLPRWINSLSLMSYSLYLIHLPLIVFAVALIRDSPLLHNAVMSYPVVAISLLVLWVVGVAHVFYLLFEAHYHRTATWLLAKVK